MHYTKSHGASRVGTNFKVKESILFSRSEMVVRMRIYYVVACGGPKTSILLKIGIFKKSVTLAIPEFKRTSV